MNEGNIIYLTCVWELTKQTEKWCCVGEFFDRMAEKRKMIDFAMAADKGVSVP